MPTMTGTLTNFSMFYNTTYVYYIDNTTCVCHIDKKFLKFIFICSVAINHHLNEL